jgi:hypothetical protein
MSSLPGSSPMTSLPDRCAEKPAGRTPSHVFYLATAHSVHTRSDTSARFRAGYAGAGNILRPGSSSWKRPSISVRLCIAGAADLDGEGLRRGGGFLGARGLTVIRLPLGLAILQPPRTRFLHVSPCAAGEAVKSTRLEINQEATLMVGPQPKWCCQIRFTITRAVNGLPGLAMAAAER